MSALSDTRAVDHKDAFRLLENDVSIKIDTSEYKPLFTRSWFRTRNQTTYSTYLPPRYPADKPHNIMLIGVFECADLLWIAQNLLRHPNSRAVGIDSWPPTRKIDQEGMNAVRDRARKNIKLFSGQVQLIRGMSQNIIPAMIDQPTKVRGKEIKAGEWDLIIIDGDHNADPVCEDAKNAMQIIRPGGWILFDDVRNRGRKADHVYHGIVGWLLDEGSEDVEMVWAHRYMNCYRKLP